MEINTGVLRYFGGDIYKALSAVSTDCSEIRLRAGRPLAVTIADRTAFVGISGELASRPGSAVTVTAEDIRRSFEAVCRYSIHSFQGRICQGFITVAGGHRAGICGTAVYSADGRIENIKNINCINFRIAHEIIGAADEITAKVMNSGLKSILICGEPCSGKTTVLRDLCRQIGEYYPVSLIDERGEIAAESGGVINNRVGICTDVFSGFSKSDGILTAVRVMSPMMIICDEIGSKEDISALEAASVSGVKIAATVHCGSPGELLCTPQLKKLLSDRVFEYCVFLRKRKITGIIRSDELLSRERKRGEQH